MRSIIVTGYIIGLCLVSQAYAVAKEPITELGVKQLTLREAILLALRYNPGVRNAELQRVIDKFNLRLAENQYEVQYALTGAGQYSENKAAGKTSHSQNFNVTPTATLSTITGGKVSLQSTNVSDGSHYNPGLTLSVDQPLLRGAGPEVALNPLWNAYDQEKIAKLNLRSTIISTITKVIMDYRQIVQDSNNVKIQRMSLESSIKTVDQNKLKIKAGTMAGMDNIRPEAQIASQRVALKSAENTLAQDRLNLLNDLGLNPTTQFSITSNINIDNVKLPSLIEGKKLILQNDTNYQSSLINYQMDKRRLVVAKNNALWQLDFNAKATMGGGSGSGRSNGVEALWNGANRGQSVGLTVNIPINNLALKQAIVSAKIQLQRDEINLKAARWNLEMNVINALRNIETQKNQIKLSINARDLVRKSLEVAQRKQHFGRATTFETTSLQNDLINAELLVVSSQIAYLNALTNFEQLLGITLDKWNIQLRY